MIDKELFITLPASGLIKSLGCFVGRCWVSAHAFRHSHLLQRGTDIRTIQALPGHNDLETTMIYTHVLNRGGQGTVGPLDDLGV